MVTFPDEREAAGASPDRKQYLPAEQVCKDRRSGITKGAPAVCMRLRALFMSDWSCHPKPPNTSTF